MEQKMKQADDLIEMFVKFWEPYAVQMAAKDIDVIERVPGWLAGVKGMLVKRLSPYELRLCHVPRERTLDIRGKVKAGVVDDLGWTEEPSHVVSIGIVTEGDDDEAPRRGLFFRKPRCMYTEQTPGFVRPDGDLTFAAMTDGTFLGGKVVIYLHGNAEDIYESRERLKPFMPPSCNLALVAYQGYGLSFGKPFEGGCYQNAHKLYDWVRKELGYSPKDILIVGYSLGSAVALELARTCLAKAVLLLAPFYSGIQALADWHPDEDFGSCGDYAPFPSDRMIKEVNCPVAVIHGEKDETCLCERGRALYDLAPNKAGFTLVPDAGHCDLLARLGPVRFKEIVSRLLAIALDFRS